MARPCVTDAKARRGTRCGRCTIPGNETCSQFWTRLLHTVFWSVSRNGQPGAHSLTLALSRLNRACSDTRHCQTQDLILCPNVSDRKAPLRRLFWFLSCVRPAAAIIEDAFLYIVCPSICTSIPHHTSPGQAWKSLLGLVMLFVGCRFHLGYSRDFLREALIMMRRRLSPAVCSYLCVGDLTSLGAGELSGWGEMLPLLLRIVSARVPISMLPPLPLPSSRWSGRRWIAGQVGRPAAGPPTVSGWNIGLRPPGPTTPETQSNRITSPPAGSRRWREGGKEHLNSAHRICVREL